MTAFDTSHLGGGFYATVASGGLPATGTLSDNSYPQVGEPGLGGAGGPSYGASGAPGEAGAWSATSF